MEKKMTKKIILLVAASLGFLLIASCDEKEPSKDSSKKNEPLLGSSSKLEFQNVAKEQLSKSINPEMLKKLSHLILDIGIRNKDGKFIEVCPLKILIHDKENTNLRKADWARFVDLSEKEKALAKPEYAERIKEHFLGSRALNWRVNDQGPTFSKIEEEKLKQIFDSLADDYLSVVFKNYSSFCAPLTKDMDETKTLFPYDIFGK
jgi:hypothetical protein